MISSSQLILDPIKKLSPLYLSFSHYKSYSFFIIMRIQNLGTFIPFFLLSYLKVKKTFPSLRQSLGGISFDVQFLSSSSSFDPHTTDLIYFSFFLQSHLYSFPFFLSVMSHNPWPFFPPHQQPKQLIMNHNFNHWIKSLGQGNVESERLKCSSDASIDYRTVLGRPSIAGLESTSSKYFSRTFFADY